MPDNLPELRDIHLPDGVSVFPLAYGWWVIIFTIIAAFLLYRLTKLILVKSKKRYALRLLKGTSQSDTIQSAAAISEILRRICVAKYPEAVVLSGTEWINFLNTKSKIKLNTKTADLLLNAPYMPAHGKNYTADDIVSLRNFCQRWIGENL